MNAKEKAITAKLLEMASDEFSNHGCNDVPESFWEGWTLEERQQLVKEFWEYNGTPEEYDPQFLHIGDSSLMSFMAHKISTL